MNVDRPLYSSKTRNYRLESEAIGIDKCRCSLCFLSVFASPIAKPFADSYCALTRKDPIETIRAIPISVLHSFFHWLFSTRKDSLRGARSLPSLSIPNFA